MTGAAAPGAGDGDSAGAGPARRRFDPWHAGVVVWLAGVSSYLFVLQAYRFSGLALGVRDLGFFVQSLWSTLQGSFLAVSVDLFSSHLWGYHFFLLHSLFVPLYALWSSPLLLLAAQAATVGAAGWLLYLLGRAWLSRPWMAATPMVAYTLHPSVHLAAAGFPFYGYHPEMMFPPLFIATAYFAARDRMRAAGACWLLSLAVREDYALLAAGLGGALVVAPRTRRLGILMMLGSLAWLVAVTGWVIPAFAGAPRPFYFSGLAHLPGIGEMRVPAAAVWPALRDYILRMVSPLGFLPLLDPFSLIAAPMYALFAAAWSAGYQLPLTPESAHGAAVLPVLAVALVRTVSGMSWFGRRARQLVGETPLVLILAAAAMLPLACPPCGPPVGLRYGLREGDFQPLPEARRAALSEVAARIPPAATLATDFFTGSQFLHRPRLYVLQDRWRDAEYILADRRHAFGELWAAERAALDAALTAPGTVTLVDREGFVLLRLGSPPGRTRAE